MDKLQKLQELIKQINDSLTREEFIASFKLVLDHLKKSEAYLSDKIDKKTSEAESKLELLNSLYQEAINRARSETDKAVEENKSNLSNIKRWALERVSDLFLKSSATRVLNEKIKEVDDKLLAVERKFTEVTSYTLPDTSQLAEEAFKKIVLPEVKEIDLKAELPAYGEEVRNALELLPDGDKLSIEAIQDLNERLEELERKISVKSSVMGGGGVGKHNVEIYDLSDQLNGVTKTFNTPAMWKLLRVESTSFPVVFRPNVDFTWTPTSVTFTDQIDAGSALATGQTVLLTFQQ